MFTRDINEAKLARIRQEHARETGGEVIAFQTPQGRIALSGDNPDEGPRVSPAGSIPVLSELYTLFDSVEMATEFQICNSIDVRSWRGIAVYIDYTFNTNGRLQILGEVSPDNVNWYTATVLDSAITQDNTLGTGNVFGQRTFYMGSSFISPAPGGAAVGAPKIAWNVEEDFFFRMQAADEAQVSTTNILTARARLVR